MIRAFVIFAFVCSLHAEDMTKIVFRNTMPKVAADSFGAKPKTLYRTGETKLRVEEEFDPAMNLHGLVIFNQRDMWMVNLANKTARHMVDRSPKNRTFASIAPPAAKDKPPQVKEFEMGHELTFMKSRNVAPKDDKFQGEDVLLYECVEDGLTLRAYVSPRTGLPIAVSAHRDDELLASLQYDEYIPSLPLDDTLFSLPDGLRISEAE